MRRLFLSTRFAWRDGPNTWLDMNIDRARAEELLKHRSYETDMTSWDGNPTSWGRSKSAHIWRAGLDWRPGRVYFLTLLEPSRDDRTLALTARSASRLPR
jgi:hypothetical protein